jgi:hypothetical protein
MTTTKLAGLFTNLAKFNIKISQIDSVTLKRISEADNDLVVNIVKSLNDNGMNAPRVLETLANHENWMLLNQQNVAKKFELLRHCGLPADISEHLIAKNPEIMDIDKAAKIKTNLKELKHFLSRQQLTTLITKSPKLTTASELNSFIYKFTYMYVLMGIKQDEMCSSFVFNHDIEHIRQRHLFLSRSGFYDKPDKRNITKVKNPKLIEIVDSKIKGYLKLCTNDLFDEYDYQTFCDYLDKEDFTDELLGFNIGKNLRDGIIDQLRINKELDNKEDLI